MVKFTHEIGGPQATSRKEIGASGSLVVHNKMSVKKTGLTICGRIKKFRKNLDADIFWLSELNEKNSSYQLIKTS